MKVQNSSQYSVNRKQEKTKKLSAVYSSPPLRPPLLRGGRRGGRGFTLIETVIVMVIAVILAAVVAVRWSPFDTIKLNSATRKVAADIRYVQKLAISNQTRAGVVFTANGYSVYPNITDLATLAASSGDVCSSDTSNKFVVDFTQDRCSNYSTVTITIPPTPNQFAFNSLGTPVDSGGTAIAGQTVRVTYKGSNNDITIEQGTGRVRY